MRGHRERAPLGGRRRKRQQWRGSRLAAPARERSLRVRACPSSVGSRRPAGSSCGARLAHEGRQLGPRCGAGGPHAGRRGGTRAHRSRTLMPSYDSYLPRECSNVKNGQVRIVGTCRARSWHGASWCTRATREQPPRGTSLLPDTYGRNPCTWHPVTVCYVLPTHCLPTAYVLPVRGGRTAYVLPTYSLRGGRTASRLR